MEKLADNGIIQEATEAVTKGYPCAFYVPQLLEVIKNKEAEIFKLKKEVEHFQLKNSELFKLKNNLVEETDYKDAEIERLKDHIVDLNKKVKHEAYREFVCRIKAHAYYIDFPKEHRVVDEDDIDNAINELTRNLHGTCTETTDQTATNHSVSLIDGHIEE